MTEVAESQVSESTNRRESTIERIFESMQEKIINALEVMLPEGFDFTDLEDLFSREIRNQMDYGLLILNLLEYFIRVTSDNLIKMTDYYALEAQTQKLQAEIRNHIKIEQSVKIYLEIKLRSLEKYKNQALQRRMQVQFLNDKLIQQDRYYRNFINNMKTSSNLSNQTKPSTAGGIPIEDSGRTTLLPPTGLAPSKMSSILNVQQEDHDEQLQQMVKKDLHDYRLIHRKVNF